MSQSWVWQYMPVILAPGRQGQEHYNFEASLSYTAIMRLAWATQDTQHQNKIKKQH